MAMKKFCCELVYSFKGKLLLHVVILDPPAVAGRVLWNRVCLSFRPSFRLSRRFLWIVSLTFFKFWHGARNPYEVVRDRADFRWKIFLPQKLENGPKMGQKQGLLNLLKNIVINFFWILSIKKFYNIYCIYYTNPILGKNLVSEIWAKMLSVNQITGIFTFDLFDL